MIKVKNLTTGEMIIINDVKRIDNVVRSEKGIKGARFVEKWSDILEAHDATLETQYFTLREGYEYVSRQSKPKETKPVEVVEEVVEQAAEEVVEKPTQTDGDESIIDGYVIDIEAGAEPYMLWKEIKEKYNTRRAGRIFNAVCARLGLNHVEARKEPEQPQAPVAQATPQAQPAVPGDMAAVTSAFAALTPLFSGVEANVMAAVMSQLQPIIDKLNQQAQTQVQHIHVHTPQGSVQEINEVVCSDFEEILTYVSQGVPVYMYGAAGCGKSHTARQLAEALGLPFYESMQVLFAHDVKGYGDAGGNYQETPFFKAFTQGGVFFLDEVDASAPEALVVLNTAIANRRFDFPIVGNVKAHPDFRVVAAGNTAMTGADIEYVARSVQDAATENRFSFFAMSYDDRVELPVCAGGDTELMSFIHDLRNAIKASNVVKCVSYRQTTLLANKELLKFGRVKALRRNVFKGMELDEIRIIYGYLENKSNVWAQAVEEIVNEGEK